MSAEWADDAVVEAEAERDEIVVVAEPVVDELLDGGTRHAAG